MDLGRARLGQHRELDQVACQAGVALGEERGRALENPRDPAGERDPLAGLLGAGAGKRLSGSPSYQPPYSRQTFRTMNCGSS